MGLFQYSGNLCFFLLVLKTCTAVSYRTGHIYPGFEASVKESIINDNGRFLISNNSVFGFGFSPAIGGTRFFLVVNHISSRRGVWTANRGSLVDDSAKLVFDNNGKVSLKMGNEVAWSLNTSGKKVASMELRDNGNLVLLGSSGGALWQSFVDPTDTLLPGQEFLEGMKLESRQNKDNLKVYLEFKLGDLVLYAGYGTPQTYWSLSNDSRKTNKSVGGRIHSAILVSNAWNFYDNNKTLIWQLVFSIYTDPNVTWATKLGSDGAITFSDLQRGYIVTPEKFKIPKNSCGTPEPCGPYHVCSLINQCQCHPSLNSSFKCRPPIASACNSSRDSAELFSVGTELDYFALRFATPLSRYNLDACKKACLGDCSCVVLFFENSSGNCFLFDQIGSFQRSQEGSSGYVSFIKVSSGNDGINRLAIVLMIVSTTVVIGSILYVGIRYHHRKRTSEEFSLENLEEYKFSNNFSIIPVRFSYGELCKATKGFSIKVGQGGFGSVYLGMLADGTQLAIKMLEGIGQGKKEFRAEVKYIRESTSCPSGQTERLLC